MIRLVALFLTTLTGFTGLVYEVLWQRSLATLLGSHSEATAAVLGIFLGGLACGYALFGRIARRLASAADRGDMSRSDPREGSRRVLFAYGVVEAAIGVYAFAFPWLFAAARAISLWVPHGLDSVAFGLDVALTAVLIGPPTILMGGTIPLLTQALATGFADATRFHALVYATNTLGAFLGAVAGGFFLLPRLGLETGVVAMGLINLGAGLAFLTLAATWRVPVAPALDAPVTADGGAVRGLGTYLIVALLGGFAMMTLQTTMNRIGALALGASHFTFATVVAAFVLCIALGSLAVSFVSRVPAATVVVVQWLLVAYLIALYPSVGDAPYWAHVLRTMFPVEPAGFYPYHLSLLGGILLVLLVPLALSGATLPLLFHHLRRDAQGFGAVAGRLYSWNTVGSLLGALLAGYLAFFWLDLHQVYRIAVAALVVGAALLSLAILERGRAVAAIGSVAALAALLVLPAWSNDRLASGLFRFREATATTHAGPDAFFAAYAESSDGATCVFYDDDPVASVAVVESGVARSQLDRSIIINGKSDGSIVGDDLTMRLLALIPAILAERLERAFIVGYGTGVTAGELAAQPDVKQITVAEIAPAVLAAAPHFAIYNGAVHENPKAHLVRSDAYRALLRGEGAYDVIISEPSNPWVTGVEMLFSREFLEAARDRLRPGGVYVQWFHTYSMDAPTVALVLSTYRQVFPGASVWFTAKNDLILIGRAADDEQPGADLERIKERWVQDRFRARFQRIGVTSVSGLLAHEILPAGVLEAADLPAAVHTLSHPILSHEAARAFFANRTAPLPDTRAEDAARIGASNSLLGRYRASASPEQWAAGRPSMVTQGCFRDVATCMTFLAFWFREEPDSPMLQRLFGHARDFWGNDVDETVLPRIASLFGGPMAADAQIDYDEAEQLDALFAEHYSHGLPFDAAVLRDVWTRCAAAGDARCRDKLPVLESAGIDLSLD